MLVPSRTTTPPGRNIHRLIGSCRQPQRRRAVARRQVPPRRVERVPPLPLQREQQRQVGAAAPALRPSILGGTGGTTHGSHVFQVKEDVAQFVIGGGQFIPLPVR